jgi:predicted RNA-binding Zn ribbon-like protein
MMPVMATATSVHDLRLIGEHPALDFCNTVGETLDGEPRDHLVDYAALLAWSLRCGLLAHADATAMRRRAAAEPVAAARALDVALDLRTAIYALCTAQAEGAPSPRAALGRLNRHLAIALAHAALGGAGRRFAWNWIGTPDALDRMLWPLARCAADLLVGEQSERIRMCSGINCHWLFLDLTKNRARRWCSMEVCGNRAKVRSFRARADGAGRR